MLHLLSANPTPHSLLTSASQEVNTALLKLYADSCSPKMWTLIKSDTNCDIEDCARWLEKSHQHHALALLQHYHGYDDRALAVWTR